MRRETQYTGKVKVIFRRIRVYGVYLVLLLAAAILLSFIQSSFSRIDASFEAFTEPEMGSFGESGAGITYHYFLDFSPSMQGFLYEGREGAMGNVAQTFERINGDGHDQMFYWCRNTIVSVGEARSFYDSMSSEYDLTAYYEEIIRNSAIPEEEEQGTEQPAADGTEDLARVIDDIDLSDIFATGYAGMTQNTTDNLQVIITDLNFIRDAGDLDVHNAKLKSFAEGLGQAAARANFCLYAIGGNYAGTGNDAYTSEQSNATTAMFYVIIYSENDSAYTRYCEQFESEVSRYIQGKYELLNHLNGKVGVLEADIQKFQNMGLVEKEFLNYANGVFDNLGTNEFALQLVKGESGNAVLRAPVAEMRLPGYYVADTLGVDSSEVSVETEWYQYRFELPFQKGTYEKSEDNIQGSDCVANMYYDTERAQWYLRVNMALGTQPDVPEPDSWYQKLMERIGKRHLVMDLKFYMGKPSYSKPAWVPAAGYPYKVETESQELLNLETVIDEVIRCKENAYSEMVRAERYLGNIVIYLLY